MPSFSEIVGTIVTFIVVTTASGHGDWAWKAIAEFRRVAIFNSHQDWGCPSIFDKDACHRYASTKKTTNPTLNPVETSQSLGAHLAVGTNGAWTLFQLSLATTAYRCRNQLRRINSFCQESVLSDYGQIRHELKLTATIVHIGPNDELSRPWMFFDRNLG